MTSWQLATPGPARAAPPPHASQGCSWQLRLELELGSRGQRRDSDSRPLHTLVSDSSLTNKNFFISLLSTNPHAPRTNLRCANGPHAHAHAQPVHPRRDQVRCLPRCHHVTPHHVDVREVGLPPPPPPLGSAAIRDLGAGEGGKRGAPGRDSTLM